MSVTAFDKDYAAAAGGVSADVLVVGDGIIGLSVAAELGRRGANVTVLGREQQGAASWASGGLLAPSTGPLPAQASAFFFESLRAYPEFVARLAEVDPELAVVNGLIELQSEESPGGGRSLPHEHAIRARHLTVHELGELEPSLVWSAGAIWHPGDGAVDARRLLAALRRTVALDARIVVRAAASARRIEFGAAEVTVITDTGSRFLARNVVLAAGAWSAQLEGLPRGVPVTPLKGQMIALSGCFLRHPVLAGHTYLVPRGDTTVVGSTSEDVGFSSTTDPETVAALARAAAPVCPELSRSRVVDAWAGVRPMTPDRLPIIGRDPDVPALIYACGHSRNGILLAPATAEAIADVVTQTIPRHDLGAFSMARFSAPCGVSASVTI